MSYLIWTVSVILKEVGKKVQTVFKLFSKMLHCMCFMNFWKQILQERFSCLKYASWWNLVLIAGKEEDLLEQNIALCFCYGRGKGHLLVILSLAEQTLDVCFTVLCFTVDALLGCPRCRYTLLFVYNKDSFIWISVPLALFTTTPSVFWTNILSLILQGHWDLYSSHTDNVTSNIQYLHLHIIKQCRPHSRLWIAM